MLMFGEENGIKLKSYYENSRKRNSRWGFITGGGGDWVVEI